MTPRAQYLYRALTIALALLLGACDQREGLTPESAYVYPPEAPPSYSFSRQGASSVDIREVELVSASLSAMYRSYLAPANVGNEAFWETLLRYYQEGYHPGYAPLSYVARSEAMAEKRADILRELQQLLDESARISGYERDGLAYIRNAEAQQGSAGYIGNRLCYADPRGLVIADVFAFYMKGAISLDQLYHVETRAETLLSAEVERQHEDLVLLPGKNYTALEHAWDMAYAHYLQWQSLIKGDGIPQLKGRSQAIFEAFVRGRLHIGYYDYIRLRHERALIYDELARAIAIRAITLLTGANTLANLHEEPVYAFQSISQAIGLIYCLPFTQDQEGRPWLSFAEARRLIDSLLQGEGLWAVERLKANAETEGSLAYVAEALSRAFGLPQK